MIHACRPDTCFWAMRRPFASLDNFERHRIVEVLFRLVDYQWRPGFVEKGFQKRRRLLTRRRIAEGNIFSFASPIFEHGHALDGGEG